MSSAVEQISYSSRRIPRPQIRYQHIARGLLVAAIACAAISLIPSVGWAGAKGLVVAAIACAIISIIPSVGWVGAIILRSVSCTLVTARVLHALNEREGKGKILLQIMRLASVALGLVGVAAKLNVLVIASIGIGIVFQVIETGVGSHQKDLYKAFSHLSLILVDTFVMIALISGGSGFIITAAVLNSVVGVIKKDPKAAIEAACYIALGGTGIASACIPRPVSELPLGSAALVTEEPKLRERKRVETTHEEGPLEPFLNPNLDIPVPNQGYSSLTSTINPLEESDLFDVELFNHGRVAELNSDLYLDRKTFDRMIAYFQDGTPGPLDKLSENALLNLYNVADLLKKEKLRLLCQQEIAIRLHNHQWRDITLFECYLEEDRSLNPLLNLFDCRRS